MDPTNAPDDLLARRRRVRRRVLIGLVIFALAVPTGIAGFLYFFLRNTLPPMAGRLELPGPTAEITIHRDARGIPQVFAETERDAYFALGFLHASDRLFQMELTRRLASGSLAQLLGWIALDADRESRLLGHRRMARAQVGRLDARTRELLEAYVAGINAYVPRTGRRPFEFKILRAPFDRWSVDEVLAILSWQSWFADRLLSDDPAYLALYEGAGAEAVEAARASYPEWAPATVARASLTPLGPLGPVLDEAWVAGLARALRPGASNALAVSARRSESGAALLALDPHVDITQLPGLWYVAGLHAADTGLDVVGITTPGTPFVSMGHNGSLAYGFTVAGVDLADYYLERLDPADPGRYATPDGYARFDTVRESIRVRDASVPIELEVRSSRHGPVVYPAAAVGGRAPGAPGEEGPDAFGDDRVVALRWAGHDADLARAARSLFGLPRATSFDELRERVTALGAANFAWVFAHAQGSIGYQLGAPVPVRGSDERLLPLEGWVEGNDWRGYRPAGELPYRIDPPDGALAACNNRPACATDIPGTYAFDRILRATEVLAGDGPISAADLHAAQLDRVDRYLERRRDLVADTLEAVGRADLADRMRRFGGDVGDDSELGAIALAFGVELRYAVFEDEIDGPGTPRMLERVLGDAGSPLFDDRTTGASETRAAVLARAMERTLERVGGRRLGDVQSLTLRHPFWQARGAAFLGLARGPYPRGGSPGSLDASFPELQEDGSLRVVAGPSWRFVLDFADVDGCRMALPAGQSGNPMSPHFFDFFELWQDGESWPLPFTREAIEANSMHTLVLAP